ncbi:hypothetical protein [Mesonia sp. K4-1]|uniref:hypothetical protein n=1 Tax=Mesonia sp. K4-1 TaxID=2602760 RepID=UPI0011CB3146|nr:hypothetical protein [Mesonia sp. K4-1]TXK75062.1 hypothetical protein FT986_11180 [Mesonia sp. K4-1]
MKPYIFIFLACLIISCKSDPKQENTSKKITDFNPTKTKKKTSQNLNLSILLDLSDRINPEKYSNPTMEYYQRDIAYIKILADVFKNQLMNKKVIQIDDKIQLYFAPEPANAEINSISNQLKFHFNKGNVTKEALENLSQNYSKLPKRIYELAIEDNQYVGSDTWGFFKNNIEDYCLDNDYRNVLVLLTDGYIYHQNNQRREQNKTSYLTPQFIRKEKLTNLNWENKFKEEGYGFITTPQNLNNLEVLVLGINPDPKNNFENDVIKKYWSEWLTNLGVKKFKLYNADLPSNLNKVINEFLE